MIDVTWGWVSWWGREGAEDRLTKAKERYSQRFKKQDLELAFTCMENDQKSFRGIAVKLLYIWLAVQSFWFTEDQDCACAHRHTHARTLSVIHHNIINICSCPLLNVPFSNASTLSELYFILWCVITFHFIFRYLNPFQCFCIQYLLIICPQVQPKKYEVYGENGQNSQL